METQVNWDNLKVALAIARAGSLSRGAALLGIDQSTAGRRLTTLEADVGTILFTRSKTGFAPTEAGQAVIDRAEEVELRITRLAEDLSQNTDGPVGLVRVLGNGWMLDHLTRHVMPEFLAANPLIDVRMISLSPQTPMRGEATVSLWFEAPPRAGEFAIKLGRVPFALYIKRGVCPEAARWISFFDEDAPRTAPVRAWEKLRGRGERRLCFTSTDARHVMTAVKAGIGKAILPMCLAASDQELVRVTDAPTDLERVMYLHAHPDTVQAHRVQAIIKCLRETFATTFTQACPAMMEQQDGISFG